MTAGGQATVPGDRIVGAPDTIESGRLAEVSIDVERDAAQGDDVLDRGPSPLDGVEPMRRHLEVTD